MKKRFLNKKYVLKTVTDKELFSELVNRLLTKEKRNIYFIDSTTAPGFPNWSVYSSLNNVLMSQK